MEISINALLLIIVALIILYLIYQNNLLVKKVLSSGTVNEEKTPLQPVAVKADKVEKIEKEEVALEDNVDQEADFDQDENDTDDVYAAIAMTLYELQNDSAQHDWEETVLTIDKVKKDYSPWSSKIYGLRETPVLRKR